MIPHLYMQEIKEWAQVLGLLAVIAGLFKAGYEIKESRKQRNTELLWKKINTAITAKPRHSRSDKLIADIGSRAHNGLIRLSETYPRLTPPLSRFTFKLTPSRGNKVVDIVEAIHYRRAIEYTKMGCVEVAFKIDPSFENVK